MISLLLSLFSSSGFGSILGLFGGAFNRYVDFKTKAQDNAFELQKMDKERDYMKEEYAQRIQVVDIESNAVIESHGYDALAESYKFAATTSADGWVDKASKILRPLLTLAFFFFTVYIFYVINSIVQQVGLQPTQEEVFTMWKQCIEWVFFQAGVSIGWWFAMRPGKSPTFGKK